MSVKPSAITGTGAETDPYVIHNYDELKWCCEDTDAVPEGQLVTDYVYIKVNNDIDCNTYGKNFRWSITCNHACDINLNTKTIQNFYILGSNYMFIVTGNSRKLSIHDGKLLNIYGDWLLTSYSVFQMNTQTDDSLISFKNVSMSIDISNLMLSCIVSNYTHKCKFTNCTFDLKGTKTSNTTSTLLSAAQLYTCDVHIDITSASNTMYILGNSSSARGYALNCRFMGSIHLPNISLTSYCMYYSTIRNCVIDVAVIPAIASTTKVAFAYQPGGTAQNYGIYNTDKLPNYTFSSTQYIACTAADMDMRINPNADLVLQEKGFDVIKG